MLYKTSTLVLVVIVAFVEVIVSQSAGVPHLLNFQGELTDPFSEPIDDPNLTVNFSFYDQPVGGSALYSEEQIVTVSDSLFSTLIGSEEPISADIFDGSDIYLGIQVETDSEMTPRQQITSVAYAFLAEKASDAELLDGYEASDFASFSHDHDSQYASTSHDHAGQYAPTSHNHDDMYYTESEIDSLFYTQSEINSLFYTKSELDPKLLSVSQKSELTEGGVTSLHYHPTGQLEAWPTYELCGGSGWTETTKTLFHCTFSKSPGSSILRVYSGCSKKTTPGKLWIETSHWGTRYLIPPEVNQWVEREDLFDLTSLPSFTEIVVTAYYIGFINNMTSGESRLYTQQNAP